MSKQKELSKVYFKKAQNWIEYLLYFLILLLVWTYFFDDVLFGAISFLVLGAPLYFSYIFLPRYSLGSLLLLSLLILFEVYMIYLWLSQFFFRKGFFGKMIFGTDDLFFLITALTYLTITFVIFNKINKGYYAKIQEEKESEILDEEF